MSTIPLPSTSAARLSRQRFLRVLYADDVFELREIARLSLSRDGHGVECVPDGEVALQRITEDPSFDLVITDHHMPRMNGLELVTQLRALNYPGRIVVFSSDLSPTTETEYRKLWVDGILYKPVFPAALRKLLAELFPNFTCSQTTVTMESPTSRSR